MGIIAGPSFTTEQGFILSTLYLSVNFYRFLTSQDGRMQCVFGVQAFKSREDKLFGRQPIHLGPHLSTVESFVSQTDFYRMSVHGVAYNALKSRWASEGYTLQDVYEAAQPGATQYIYDASGYDIDGYNALGFNAAGFNNHGYNALGFNSAGFNAIGYNAEGYNSGGFNSSGYTADGYDMMGFNRDGWNRSGFGRDGYNQQGLDVNGNPRPEPPSMPPSTSTTYMDMSGSQTDVSGSSTDLSGSSTDLSGSSTDLSGSSTDLSGSSTDMSGSQPPEQTPEPANP
jgi:hypothetical protein